MKSSITEVTLGVDIGGTNTVMGLVDRSGECVREASIPTNGHEGAPRLAQRVHEASANMYAPVAVTHMLRGVGIGAPSGNYYQGTVKDPPNLGWKGTIDLVALFKKHFDVPVVLTNDANAAALGEMLFGTAKGMKDFIEITLGTGVGSGIVANGALVYGADGFAGEIGHAIVYPDGRLCGCGRRGCLETYASAGGICRTVFELLADRKVESALRQVSFNALTAKMISDAAQQGDPIALEAFEFTGRVLGLQLANSVAHTSPEAIILFGGLAAAGELIFAPIRRSLEENLLGLFKGKVKVLPSGLKESGAAVLGASALIWNELEGRKG